MRIETIHNSLMQSCTYIIEDGRANMSYMYVDDFSVQNDKMFQFINNRENVYVFNQKLTAIHTPGHDIDCMCYLINDSIFTGDSFNPDFPVFTEWYRSNKDLAEKNELVIGHIISQFNLKVFSGHYKNNIKLCLKNK